MHQVAYSFYNVATTVTLEKLMRDALICAKKLDLDVFNALECMVRAMVMVRVRDRVMCTVRGTVMISE